MIASFKIPPGVNYIFSSGGAGFELEDTDRRYFVMPSKWKFRQIKPQKARGKLRDSIWNDPEWIAEEKYDGFRATGQFCGKVVRLLSGRVNTEGEYTERTQQVPHLSGLWTGRMTATEANSEPPPPELEGTVLDMEIVPSEAEVGRLIEEGGAHSKAVGSIINSSPEEAVRKQIERGWLRAVVFDCLWYKGKSLLDLPLMNRRAMAEQAVEAWANPYVSMSKFTEKNKRAFYQAIVSTGGEGVVLKHKDHRYGDQTLWVKVKYSATADVVIMGFEDAKKMSVKKGEDEPTMTKYAKAGLIGAIRCGQRSKLISSQTMEVATVSGMTDDLRRDFTNDPKGYIGKVIEIEHNGREPTGRFRHPRFKRFRQDKSAKDCIYDLNES